MKGNFHNHRDDSDSAKDEPIDDIIIDQDAAGDEADADDPVLLAGKIKKLKAELQACRTERAEYLAGWQRAKADYLNLKKEEESHRRELSSYAKVDVLNDLIRLADSFDMAFANKTAWESVPENWRKGVEYIHSQLLVVFRDHGLEELNPIGQSFDPTMAEAIGTIPVESEKEDSTVLEVTKKGYRIGNRIIRPAQVRIGTYKKEK